MVRDGRVNQKCHQDPTVYHQRRESPEHPFEESRNLVGIWMMGTIPGKGVPLKNPHSKTKQWQGSQTMLPCLLHAWFPLPEGATWEKQTAGWPEGALLHLLENYERLLCGMVGLVLFC